MGMLAEGDANSKHRYRARSLGILGRQVSGDILAAGNGLDRAHSGRTDPEGSLGWTASREPNILPARPNNGPALDGDQSPLISCR